MFGSKDKMLKARKAVEKAGAKIIDRLMITDLITNGDQVLGAVGFHTHTGDAYVIKAKATVLASGMVSFKGSGFGRHLCNGDG